MTRPSPLRAGLTGSVPPIPLHPAFPGDVPTDVIWSSGTEPTYVYDGPGPDAKLLGVFGPDEEITADAPRVWLSNDPPRS